MMRGMVIDMKDRQLLMLADLRSSLDGTVALDFAAAPDERGRGQALRKRVILENRMARNGSAMPIAIVCRTAPQTRNPSY
jgi:hypothetical protein